MRMRLGWLPLLVAGAIIGGCGEDRSSGISFETENVRAARLVLDVDSIAPPSQRLGWYPYVASIRLDSNNFMFDSAASDGSDVVVERMDGTAVPFAIQGWSSKDAWARLLVRIEGDLLAGGRTFLVRVDPEARYQSSASAVWAWIPDTLRSAWSSTLVDDFEHGELRNLLPNTSVWFTGKADSATLSPPTLVAAGGGRAGTAVRFDYNAPASRHDYVHFETKLSSHPVNFRSLDSIVFWARGQGILSVSLDHLWDGGGSKTWMHDDLDTAWRRWCVRPADFDPPGSTAGNLGWASVHDSVTHLTFFATGSGTVMLDEIRIYGLVKDDFR